MTVACAWQYAWCCCHKMPYCYHVPPPVAFNGEKYQKTRRKNKKNEIKMACYPVFFANFAEARKSLADSIMK